MFPARCLFVPFLLTAELGKKSHTIHKVGLFQLDRVNVGQH